MVNYPLYSAHKGRYFMNIFRFLTGFYFISAKMKEFCNILVLMCFVFKLNSCFFRHKWLFLYYRSLYVRNLVDD